MQDPEFIVAEVSKNWTGGTHSLGDHRTILSQRFEAVIATNRQRGYVLHSFQMDRILTSSDAMNETIIAVFRKESS